VFGSLVGFTAYNWLLRHTRPVIATSYAYVIPFSRSCSVRRCRARRSAVTTFVANALIVGGVALALGKPRPH